MGATILVCVHTACTLRHSPGPFRTARRAIYSIIDELALNLGRGFFFARFCVGKVGLQTVTAVFITLGHLVTHTSLRGL